MDEDLHELTRRYTLKRNITLREPLGFGVHGNVFAAEDNTNRGFFALKLHREQRPFEQECSVYERLREEQVAQIQGLNVPQLLRADQEFRTIEMTIVRKPFLLGFADARLDQAPDFSDDVIQQWQEQKAEIFGERWPDVTRVLAALQGLGIYLLDVNPGNITLPD